MASTKNWTSSWKSSKKPKKQRKYRTNAPLHIRQKMMGCHLSPELRKKYGIRAVSIRKGDKVMIMSGSFRKKTGKVDDVNLKWMKVTITGIEVAKKDGSKVKPYFHPSNLMITELELGDKRREDNLKKKTAKKEG